MPYTDHRILEFDIKGNCVAKHSVEPDVRFDIFDQIQEPHEKAISAQWQTLHSKYGWQGLENRYK